MTESQTTPESTHRQFAVDLFNRTWDLLDLAERAQEHIDEMINAAHASRYHWSVIGEPVNLARGDWQISRVYAVLGRAEPALHHARRSLEIVQGNGIADFDLAFAYEALARAHAVGGNAEKSREALVLARSAGEGIAAKDDRDWFFTELETVPTS